MPSRFVILNPCPKKWADLDGDDRERTCATCSRSVHAIERYSTEEWEQVWRDSEGDVCGMLARESRPEPRSRRAMLLGAMLTAAAPLLAKSGRLWIRVVDQTGEIVPNATVSLLGKVDEEPRTALTNAEGEAVFTDLPKGNSRFEVQSPGFLTRRLTISVRGAKDEKAEVMLYIPVVGTVVEVEEAPVKTRPKRRRWLIFR